MICYLFATHKIKTPCKSITYKGFLAPELGLEPRTL